MIAAIPDAVIYQRALAVAEEEIARTEIEGVGGTVHELTPDEHYAFAAAVAPIYAEAQARFGNDMFAMISSKAQPWPWLLGQSSQDQPS